jgi:gliding motility-associated-like protein
VAPTAFHPSGNVNENRDFYVFTFFITDNFQIFIYNRWGELVYQSGDRKFKWNGNFNNSGLPMPGGTYAYVIKYVSSFEPQQGVQEKHGGVVLLR